MTSATSPALAELIPAGSLEAARRVVMEAMPPTPQRVWPLLAERAGCELWVKHENHTPIGAFKLRGGLVYMDRLRREQPCIGGVITATRGNHGQSVALAAARAGLRAVVVVPRGNSPEKNAAMRAFGAEVIEHGADFQEAYDHATAMAAGEGLHPLRAYHPWLVQGVATCGLEFLEAVPELDVVYVPVGQGSGISGMLAAKAALGRRVLVKGVVAETADAYARSFRAGRAVATDSAVTFADGLACRKPDERALEVVMDGAADVVTVSDAEMAEAVRLLFAATHNAAEGAGAAALAAACKEREANAGKRVGVVLSGANIDSDRFAAILQGEVPR